MKKIVTSLRKGVSIAAMLKEMKPLRASKRMDKLKGSLYSMVKAPRETPKAKAITIVKKINSLFKTITKQIQV